MQSTIALLKYQLLALLPRRAVLVLLLLVGVCGVLALFVAALSLTAASTTRSAFYIEGLRYCLAFWWLLQISSLWLEDRRSQHLSWLLSLPLSPLKLLLSSVLAQALVAALLLMLFSLPLWFMLSPAQLVYWWFSQLLELILLQQLALWLALSLPNLASAVMLSAAIWIAALWQGWIARLLLQQQQYGFAANGWSLNHIYELIVQCFSWVLPAPQAFVMVDHILDAGNLDRLSQQLLAAGSYFMLLSVLSLFELYRHRGRH